MKAEITISPISNNIYRALLVILMQGFDDGLYHIIGWRRRRKHSRRYLLRIADIFYN
jgi:hypothetical protein